MTLIDGIGGAFLFSNQPKELAKWYRDNLLITPDGEDPETGAAYKSFEYSDLTNPSQKKSTTWAIMPSEKDVTGKPRTGQINYRVTSMEKLLAHLKLKGITVEDQAEYDYGKFAWIRDPDGNRVELYEQAP